MNARTVATALCLAGCAASSVRAAGPAAGGEVVRIPDRYRAALVRYALAGASARLVEPRCQGLLEEFSDEQGRLLADNLAALGLDGRSLMTRLLIYDAGNHDLCRTGRALAITRPGTRVVLVCTERFAQTYIEDPALAEAVLIHEALHGLGLGENPPSSGHITARVRKLCRRKAA